MDDLANIQYQVEGILPQDKAAARVLRILNLYTGKDANSTDLPDLSTISDLLADLMHFCEKHAAHYDVVAEPDPAEYDETFAYLLDSATVHYLAERGEPLA